MSKLRDMNAIVTGGGRGIGREICLKLARQGANVAVIDINTDWAGKVANEVNALGVKAIPVQTDVSVYEEVKSMSRTVVDAFGSIDILVNNAAGRTKKIPRAAFWETTDEAWHAGISLTLDSVFYCCRAVVGNMMKKQRGRIVNISSIDGMVGGIGAIDYSAAKAGVFGFTMALAKELAPYGININCVSPGPVATPGLATNTEARLKAYVEWTGMGRLGKPEEIGDIVAFLVSDEADFITGQNFPVCGLANLATWRD